MSLYVHDIPLQEAIDRFSAALKNSQLNGVLGKETIPVDENAVGRILFDPVWARISSPHYHASAMDGYAIRAKTTKNTTLTRPTIISLPDEAEYVDTGDPLPESFDAVIPIENVERLDKLGNITNEERSSQSIRIRASVSPWSNVRPMGEDIIISELVLPSDHAIRPVDLGAIAGSGNTKIVVSRKPKIAILPTGNELVQIGEELKLGSIIEYNSLILAAQIMNWGGLPTRFPIVQDNLKSLENEIKQAASQHDLILVNAGSSAGSEDYTAKAIANLGEVLVHGIAVRPGHPVILGIIKSKNKTTPVIGVPGYPVSATLTSELFVKPLITQWLGITPPPPETVNAKLTRKITSPSGDDELIRVSIAKVGKTILAAPLNRGAGVITSLVKADGLLMVPSGSQGEQANTMVNVQLLRNWSEIENSIFVTGSHDITLDILTQRLAEKNRKLTIVNVGSLGGLIALQKELCHFSGSHLLDQATGQYNFPFLDKYLPDIPVKIVSMVERDQGLIVKKGNPKNIHNLEDLSNPNISFINRQLGAGTRVLLDYQLKLMNLTPDSINGYKNEEYTHLTLAAAISSGRADCGLGIAAAATALNLDFIPLFKEHYELIFPLQHINSDLLNPVWEILADEDFKKSVNDMKGYDSKIMGATSFESS